MSSYVAEHIAELNPAIQVINKPVLLVGGIGFVVEGADGFVQLF
jgi:hypothetical protein